MKKVRKIFSVKEALKIRELLFVLVYQIALPTLLKADARIDSEGKLRFQLMREDKPAQKRLLFGFMTNSDMEYMTSLRYIVNKNLGISTHYYSEMAIGMGVMLNY
jgi:hypothetical protein